MFLGGASDVEMHVIGDDPMVQRRFGILGDTVLEYCKCKETIYINECYIKYLCAEMLVEKCSQKVAVGRCVSWI